MKAKSCSAHKGFSEIHPVKIEKTAHFLKKLYSLSKMLILKNTFEMLKAI
jgi:hypothetical protein